MMYLGQWDPFLGRQSMSLSSENGWFNLKLGGKELKLKLYVALDRERESDQEAWTRGTVDYPEQYPPGV